MTPSPSPDRLAPGFSESFLQGVYADLLYAKGDADYARTVATLLEIGALERRFPVPKALDPDGSPSRPSSTAVKLLPTLRPGSTTTAHPSPGRRPRLKEPNPGAREEDAGSTYVEHAEPRGPNEGGERP